MKPKYLHAAIVVLSLLVVGTQPALGTKYIPSDPDIGTWDSVNRIYTLTENVSETIQIDDDNLTLDGARHTIRGDGPGFGVRLFWRTGVTVKDLNIQGFSYGIYLYYSSNNTLTDNIASNNSYGIRLRYSNNNTLTGNTANSNNLYGIYLAHSSNSTLTNNTANSNKHYNGITLLDSPGSTLTNNTANSNSYNYQGIMLQRSSNSTLTGNIASNNRHGIYLYSSGNCTLTGNTANSNDYAGIRLHFSNGNTMTNNTVNLNNLQGIYLYGSSNNEIYNNNFIDNTVQAHFYGGSGNVFNLPAPTGGNYWSNWTGPDDNGDGIVDYPYIYGRVQDYLPWVHRNGWVLARIEQLIDQVEAINLQQGTSNSLDAKLDAIMRALDDVNANNDVAAVNGLNAFINAVEAQRGNLISIADADALIAAARQIIAMLNDN